MTDSELNTLIRGCQENKPSAQKQLYDMFAGKMFGICLRYCKSHSYAEDILQEGFVKVFRNISTYAFRGSFEGWMYRIFINTALEKLRKKSFEMPIDELYEFENGYFDNNDVHDDLSAQELLSMIQELPSQYRTVFNLYAIDGYSHKDISEYLNISEGTSKSNLSRARTILKQKFEAMKAIPDKYRSNDEPE